MKKNNLENLQITSPCAVDWQSLCGDEQVRACAQCRLNVFNLSAMTKADAEKLLNMNEQRICVRILRRSDGTIVTDECPRFLRKARLGINSFWLALGLGVLFSSGTQAGLCQSMGAVSGSTSRAQASMLQLSLLSAAFIWAGSFLLSLAIILRQWRAGWRFWCMQWLMFVTIWTIPAISGIFAIIRLAVWR